MYSQLRGVQQVVQMPDGKNYVLRSQTPISVSQANTVSLQPGVVNTTTGSVVQPTQYIVKNAQGTFWFKFLAWVTKFCRSICSCDDDGESAP